MKKIGLICLCLASLGLVGCFHVPDEDWLPSRNKVKTEGVNKDIEFEQAVDSLVDGINMISSEWDKINDDVIEARELEETSIETKDEIINTEEAIEDEESTDDDKVDHEIEENIIPEE